MKWYGKNNYSGISRISIKNSKKNHNLKLKKSSIFFRNRFNFNFNKIIFYIPSNWNFIILKKKNSFGHLNCFYLYSSTYFFLLPLLKNFLNVQYDSQISSLVLKFQFSNNFHLLFWNFFKAIFYSFSKIFFKKLKFKGKGYYIFKNLRNTIALQFGYSHRLYLYSFSTTVKFLTKTTILMFGINKNDVIANSKSLFFIRPINIFTGKGIRFSRQIVYRKTGKVSSYR